MLTVLLDSREYQVILSNAYHLAREMKSIKENRDLRLGMHALLNAMECQIIVNVEEWVSIQFSIYTTQPELSPANVYQVKECSKLGRRPRLVWALFSRNSVLMMYYVHPDSKDYPQ